MGTALNMAVNAGLGRRSRSTRGCIRRMRPMGMCTMNIGTKAIQMLWATTPTPICAVCWTTCPKQNG